MAVPFSKFHCSSSPFQRSVYSSNERCPGCREGYHAHVEKTSICYASKEIDKKDFKGISKFNYWIAVKITNGVGTMWCAYAFLVIDFIMLPPVIAANNVMVWISYIAQTVLQLVLLPIIMVRQNVIQTQNESKADTDHQTLTNMATLQDEQMNELKNQTEILIRLEELMLKKKPL
jgi:hypothetical protein